jgi:hypothetical protein
MVKERDRFSKCLRCLPNLIHWRTLCRFNTVSFRQPKV